MKKLNKKYVKAIRLAELFGSVSIPVGCVGIGINRILEMEPQLRIVCLKFSFAALVALALVFVCYKKFVNTVSIIDFKE